MNKSTRAKWNPLDDIMFSMHPLTMSRAAYANIRYLCYGAVLRGGALILRLIA
eukprot:SAG22_NODE_943_length_6400_cov_3.214093_7_plen_53_part_00